MDYEPNWLKRYTIPTDQQGLDDEYNRLVRRLDAPDPKKWRRFVRNLILVIIVLALWGYLTALGMD